MRVSTTMRGVVWAVAAVGLIAWAVVGVGGSRAAGDPPPQIAPVTHADAAVQSALGAFRRPLRQDDVVPIGVRSALSGSEGVDDVNPDLGRAVGPGGRLYLMPGDGKLCVGRDLDPGSVVYCTEDESLANGEFVGAVVHTAAGLEVSGIVGDGASQVRVTTAEGVVGVDVVDGAVLTTTAAPPRSISWTDRDGARHTQAIGVPR